jgi:hypothetical protein
MQAANVRPVQRSVGRGDVLIIPTESVGRLERARYGLVGSAMSRMQYMN